MYTYQFGGAEYANPLKQTVGYGEVQYSNNFLQYCSVQSISMLQYSYQVGPTMAFPVSRIIESRLTNRQPYPATTAQTRSMSLICISPLLTFIRLRTSYLQRRPTWAFKKHIKCGPPPRDRYGCKYLRQTIDWLRFYVRVFWEITWTSYSLSTTVQLEYIYF